MNQRHSDTLLLEQAYKATQLTQHLPNMTMQQVQLVIENASPSELEVIEEGFGSLMGGLRNVAKGGIESAQRAGSAIKGAAAGAGETLGKAARAGGAAVGAAAGKVAGNVKGMYQTGVSAAEAQKRKQQLINHLAQLEDLFNAHKEATKDSRLKAPFNNMTIKQLKHALGATAGVTQRAAATARGAGFGAGAGKAARLAAQKAWDKEKKEKETGPAPGAAPAPA